MAIGLNQILLSNSDQLKVKQPANNPVVKTDPVIEDSRSSVEASQIRQAGGLAGPVCVLPKTYSKAVEENEGREVYQETMLKSSKPAKGQVRSTHARKTEREKKKTKNKKTVCKAVGY